MKKLSKQQWIFIGISSLLFVLLMLIASLFDLEISDKFYNNKLFFSNYGDVMGGFPFLLVIPFLGAVLFAKQFKGSLKLNSKWLLVIKIGGLFISFVGFLLVFGHFEVEKFISYDFKYKWSYIITLVSMSTIITNYLFAKIPKETIDKFFIVICFFAAVGLLSGAFTQIGKWVFQRQRYRTMLEDRSFYINNKDALAGIWLGKDSFTPWYIPASIFRPKYRTSEYIKTIKSFDRAAFYSFPSGHTSSAGTTFGFIIFPILSKKFYKHRWFFWLVPIAVTTLTGISRVIYGAHFLSDVVVGGFISFVTASVLRFILVKKVPQLNNIFDPKIEELIESN